MEDLKRSEVKNGKEDRTISQVKKLRADWKTLQVNILNIFMKNINFQISHHSLYAVF